MKVDLTYILIDNFGEKQNSQTGNTLLKKIGENDTNELKHDVIIRKVIVSMKLDIKAINIVNSAVTTVNLISAI